VKIGLRKYSAFLLSLSIYAVLFISVIAFDLINSSEIPSFAFQLGVGISTVTGTFYAGNVMAKKYQETPNAK
jgi:hypothetical protein